MVRKKLLKFSEKVHKTIALEAYRSSVNMAKERGAFEIYDAEREKNNPFINRLREADPGTVRGNEEIRPPQHCLSHHRTDRHDKPDDANHFRYRTRIPTGIQATSQSQSE